MRRANVWTAGLAMAIVSCGRAVPGGKEVAIPEAQRQFGAMTGGFFSESDKAQAAADAKATSAAGLHIFDAYKARSDEGKRAVHWVGRCLTPADYSKEKAQAGLLLADAGRAFDNRTIFALSDVDSAQCQPGQLMQFDGQIAHLKVEFLAPMEGRLFEASASTRGEVWFDASGFKPLGITRARVIVEIAPGSASPYQTTPSSRPAP